jgi:hypothetical protein
VNGVVVNHAQTQGSPGNFKFIDLRGHDTSTTPGFSTGLRITRFAAGVASRLVV